MVVAAESNPIVVFIAAEPGAAARLLAAHVNDGTDYCRACVRNEHGARAAGPCPLHGLAVQALDLAGPRRRWSIARTMTVWAASPTT
jgi:hypothetical protein